MSQSNPTGDLMQRLSDSIDAANKRLLEGDSTLTQRERELLTEYNSLDTADIPEEFLSTDPEVRKKAFEKIRIIDPNNVAELEHTGALLSEKHLSGPDPEQGEVVRNKKPINAASSLLNSLLKRI